MATPSDLRSLRVAAYFAGSSNGIQANLVKSGSLMDITGSIAKALMGQRPYRVPFRAVWLWMSFESVPPLQVLHALNGSLVGLACLDHTIGEAREPLYKGPSNLTILTLASSGVLQEKIRPMPSVVICGYCMTHHHRSCCPLVWAWALSEQ